jgi:hypothetical protein
MVLAPVELKRLLLGYYAVMLLALCLAAGTVVHSMSEEGHMLVADVSQLRPPSQSAEVTQGKPAEASVAEAVTATQARVRLWYFWHGFYVICWVLLCGALGGWVHGIASLVMHTGRGDFYASWSFYYLTRPWLGLALSGFLYVVLKAGLGGLRSDNEFSLLAWGALAGLFNAGATQKLKDLFDALFQPRYGDTVRKPVSTKLPEDLPKLVPPLPMPAIQPPLGGVAPEK